MKTLSLQQRIFGTNGKTKNSPTKASLLGGKQENVILKCWSLSTVSGCRKTRIKQTQLINLINMEKQKANPDQHKITNAHQHLEDIDITTK